MSTYLQSAMAPAGSNRRPQRIGTTLVWVGKITGTASYATGGDTLPAKLLGMNAIEHGLVGTAGLTSTAVIEVLPQSDGSAKIRWTVAAGTELANATNLLAFASQAMFFGH
jgi:hypothetical protein